MFEYKKIVDEMLKQNGFEHQSLSYLEKRYKDTEYFGDDYNESLRLFKFLFAAHTKETDIELWNKIYCLFDKSLRHYDRADANEKVVYRRVSTAPSGICKSVCENAFRRRVRILSGKDEKMRNRKFIVTKQQFKVCYNAGNIGFSDRRD